MENMKGHLSFLKQRLSMECMGQKRCKLEGVGTDISFAQWLGGLFCFCRRRSGVNYVVFDVEILNRQLSVLPPLINNWIILVRI